MKRSTIVWLCLVAASICMITLVLYAEATHANDGSAVERMKRDEEATRAKNRFAVERKKRQDGDYKSNRGAAGRKKRDEEATYAKRRAAMVKKTSKPNQKAQKDDRNTMCNYKGKLNKGTIHAEQLIAARVLAKQGPNIKLLLDRLFNREVSACFNQLIKYARKIDQAIEDDYSDDDPEDLALRSIFGDVIGSIFGASVGNTIDDATHAIQTGIESFAPKGFGDVTKGVASIGNGLLGVVSGAGGKDAKAKEKEEAKKKSVIKPGSLQLLPLVLPKSDDPPKPAVLRISPKKKKKVQNEDRDSNAEFSADEDGDE